MNGSQIINQVGTSMGNRVGGNARQTVPVQSSSGTRNISQSFQQQNIAQGNLSGQQMFQGVGNIMAQSYTPQANPAPNSNPFLNNLASSMGNHYKLMNPGALQNLGTAMANQQGKQVANPFLQNLGASMAQKVKGNNDPLSVLKNVAGLMKTNNTVGEMNGNDNVVSLVQDDNGTKVYRHVTTCGSSIMVNNVLIADTTSGGKVTNEKDLRVQELIKSKFVPTSAYTQNQGDRTVDVQNSSGVVRQENIKTSTIKNK